MRRSDSEDSLWAFLELDPEVHPAAAHHATTAQFPFPQESMDALLAEEDNQDDMPPLEPGTPPPALPAHREANDLLNQVIAAAVRHHPRYEEDEEDQEEEERVKKKPRRTLGPLPEAPSLQLNPHAPTQPRGPKPHRTLGPHYSSSFLSAAAPAPPAR